MWTRADGVWLMAYGMEEEARAADGMVFQSDLVLQAIRYQLPFASDIHWRSGVDDIYVHE